MNYKGHKDVKMIVRDVYRRSYDNNDITESDIIKWVKEYQLIPSDHIDIIECNILINNTSTSSNTNYGIVFQVFYKIITKDKL